MRFRAWYLSGVYEGEGVEAFKALPPEGVLWITTYPRPGYRNHYNGGDWYKWDGDTLGYIPSGEWGTWQPRPDGCASCIKKGVGVSDEEFERVKAEAYRGD